MKVEVTKGGLSDRKPHIQSGSTCIVSQGATPISLKCLCLPGYCMAALVSCNLPVKNVIMISPFFSLYSFFVCVWERGRPFMAANHLLI